MVCKQCGHKLPKGAQVCPRCGWMANSGEIAELSNDISEALAKNKKQRGAGKWVAVVLIAAVLLLAVVIPLSTRSQAPEDTGEAEEILVFKIASDTPLKNFCRYCIISYLYMRRYIKLSLHMRTL